MVDKINLDYNALIYEIDELKKEINNLNNKIEYFNKSNSNLSKNFLKKEDIIKIDDPYYDELRWDIYYEEMINELKNFKNIDSVLEIGPYKAPFIENSDVIDRIDFSEYFPHKVNEVIVHDCTKLPYPIPDKKYDLVIASQVLEHLGYEGEQVEIIKEIARISKKAIIGLPYKWYRPFDRSHHMIDERVFDDWQGEFDYIYQIKSDMTILRIYDFEK